MFKNIKRFLDRTESKYARTYYFLEALSNFIFCLFFGAMFLRYFDLISLSDSFVWVTVSVHVFIGLSLQFLFKEKHKKTETFTSWLKKKKEKDYTLESDYNKIKLIRISAYTVLILGSIVLITQLIFSLPEYLSWVAVGIVAISIPLVWLLNYTKKKIKLKIKE